MLLRGLLALRHLPMLELRLLPMLLPLRLLEITILWRSVHVLRLRLLIIRVLRVINILLRLGSRVDILYTWLKMRLRLTVHEAVVMLLRSNTKLLPNIKSLLLAKLLPNIISLLRHARSLGISHPHKSTIHYT